MSSDGNWEQIKRVKGPGFFPNTPERINTSGFKEVRRKPWMLYSGIAAIVIGVLGTGYTFYLAANKSLKRK